MASVKKLIEKSQAAMRAGDYGEAERILAKINDEPAKRNMESLLLYSDSLVAQQKIPHAVVALEAAEQQARLPWQKVKILNMMADLLCGRQQAPAENVVKAIGFLERSVALNPRPGNAQARKNLCALNYLMHNFEAVDRHAEHLVEVPEYEVKASLWLASASFFLDHKKRGEPYLLKAAEVAGTLDDSDLSWLLEMLMNYRFHSQAQQVIDQELSSGRSKPVFSFEQARLFYEVGKYEHVLDILTEELSDSQRKGSKQSHSVLFMRGRSLDAIGKYAGAHECFTKMNEVARRSYPSPVAKDFSSAYTGIDLESLPEYELPGPIPYVPAFMVGFPRSGTTLLDTILDTQGEIRTLSETEGVLAARQAMTAMGHEYPEELSQLSRQEIDRLREVYFSYSAQYLGSDDSFQVLIDKVSLNIVHMPFIKILFPGARFVFSLRHPLDVCLSCFQQNMKLTDEMLHFTDLETTFRRYRDVMSAYLRFQDAGNYDLLTVRYENLVEDFEDTVRDVFAFLDIEPDESYKDFHEINRQKLSATPSRDQVVQPLYQSSRYRWHHYAEFLEPYISIVQPLIDHFGYSLGD